ncbi:unnamed protein product [Phyllotreta striolata]|uniref:Uncharacterized protein n=1 Tax=Phyllotreta striolata TaxID=444603 RepID=A0A9N9XRS4_PHYSR|nr:unnamed protein product [Phyllotreta striolata]
MTLVWHTRICLVLIIAVYFTCVTCEISNGQCVKVYYTDDNFFRIQCFRVAPTQNVLALTTEAGDTVEFFNSTISSDCFTVQHRSGNDTAFVCSEYLRDPCVKMGEKRFFWKDSTRDSGRIPCVVPVLPVSYGGIKAGNLSLIINDVVLTSFHIVDVPDRYPQRE